MSVVTSAPVAASSPVQAEAWAARALPPVESVRAGIWSIPVPLPFASLPYVIVYALETGDGLVLIDAGHGTDEAWSALQRGLGAMGAGFDDVRAVLVTHVHADHYGLAGRIREASGAWVGLHPLDARLLELSSGGSEALLGALLADLERWGAPGAVVGAFREAVRTKPVEAPALPDRLIEEGPVAGLGLAATAIWTPGHSPGHLCFHLPERAVLLTGDHVLPTIRPNVGVFLGQPEDPVGDFVRSLERLRSLRVSVALPAHEYRFQALGVRLAQLPGEVARHIDEVWAALCEHPGSNAWELSAHVSADPAWAGVSPLSQFTVVGEVYAALLFLERLGLALLGADARWAPSPSADAAAAAASIQQAVQSGSLAGQGAE